MDQDIHKCGYHIAGNFPANNVRSFRDFLRFAKIINNTVQNGRVIKFAKINSMKMIFGRIHESLLPRNFLAIGYIVFGYKCEHS